MAPVKQQKKKRANNCRKCDDGCAVCSFTQKPDLYRILWRDELRSVLDRQDYNDLRRLLPEYLSFAILAMLPALVHESSWLGILTYYSTIPSSHETEHTLFSRIPVSTLGVDVDACMTKLADRGTAGKNLAAIDYQRHMDEDDVMNMREQARAMLKQAPIRRADIPKSLQTMADRILKEDKLSGSAALDDDNKDALDPHYAFLAAMASNPLTPVNLSEALSVDFHLLDETFREIVVECLFGVHEQAVSRKHRDDIQSDMYRFLLKAVYHEDVLKAASSGSHTEVPLPFPELDSPIFSSDCVTKAKEEIDKCRTNLKPLEKTIEARPGEKPRDRMDKRAAKLDKLVESLFFEFEIPEANPSETEIIPWPLTKLKDLAVSLLHAKVLSGQGGTRVDLSDLWKENRRPLTPPAKGSMPDVGPFDVFVHEHRMATCPNLPFFLLALYWKTTYRDLMRYIAPAFLIGAMDLHIESVDECDTPRELLLRMIDFMIRNDKNNDGYRDEPLVRVAPRMIAEYSSGNLALLRRRRDDDRCAEHEGRDSRTCPMRIDLGLDNVWKCTTWLSRLDCMVRNTVTPLRQMERLAQARKQERIAQELGKDLIHDLRGKLMPILTATSRKEAAGTYRVIDMGLDAIRPPMVHPDIFTIISHNIMALTSAGPLLSMWCDAFYAYYTGDRSAKLPCLETDRRYSLGDFVELMASPYPTLSALIVQETERVAALKTIYEYRPWPLSLILENLFKNIRDHAYCSLPDVVRLEIENLVSGEMWFSIFIGNFVDEGDNRHGGQGGRTVKEFSDFFFGPKKWKETPRNKRISVRGHKKYFAYTYSCEISSGKEDVRLCS